MIRQQQQLKWSSTTRHVTSGLVRRTSTERRRRQDSVQRLNDSVHANHSQTTVCRISLQFWPFVLLSWTKTSLPWKQTVRVQKC